MFTTAPRDTGASLGTTLRAGVAEATALLDAHVLPARDQLGLLPDDELLELTRVAEELGRRADALRTLAAAEVGRRSGPERGAEGLSSRLGCRNPAELLERLCSVSGATARTRLRLGAHIAPRFGLAGETLPSDFPAARAAFSAGELGIDSLVAITGTLSSLTERCGAEAVAAAEGELVAAATGTAPDGAPPAAADEIRMQAKLWALYLDPDGVLPDPDRTMRRRGLTLGRERDGLTPLSGALTIDVAAQLQRLFDAQISPRVADRGRPAFTEDTAGAHDAAHARDDSRTRAQRQHDALAAILGVAARAAESPSIGGSAPTLLVTISASELERRDGFGLLDAAHLSDDMGADAVAQPIPATFARQVACSGGIQRLVLDANGRIIELGGPQRVFTAHQRRAIIARDGGCVIPGCHVPSAWCEVHHATDHARGGPTHTDNGVLLCWFHHRTLETSGWEVRMRNGVPETRAPAWVEARRPWRPVHPHGHRRGTRARPG
ncbi:HNH endonuclease signature motif containing protein [Microbacterium lacus]|uniref:HNH endonuclease signature motif containing protein n=1 Tax=Microbacterium lacus TaxID=415217 RepID=UPI000C2C7006|nr:HNH endonuclease signature motif containing protein [Microbacterium lacus]